MQSEQIAPAGFIIASNGWTTLSSPAIGQNPPILYLIDSNSGFLVGTDSQVQFGFLEKQTGGLSTSSFSGAFFFGGDAPTTGAQYQSGTVNLAGGNVTGSGDVSGPNGLSKDTISPSNGGTYSFLSSSSPVGRGTVGSAPNQSIAYAISASKIVFMSTGTDPELFIVQK
jgi:hypothetical protein